MSKFPARMRSGKNIAALVINENRKFFLIIIEQAEPIDVLTIITPVPDVDMEKCSLCGKCAEICLFNAIVVLGETVLPFHELCHSCGGCIEVCPEKAITEAERELGIIEKGHRNGLEFVHGKLRIGEAWNLTTVLKVARRSKTFGENWQIVLIFKQRFFPQDHQRQGL